ncbi:MFS transporter [Paracidovorax citrulli]|uniref:Major facilitator superfamily MFS_1 n=2 Tax=Paracidovorax citrulli TaxID=80869 RepID=A1TVY8_PARC0|nr:major facilitator superfamily MFS_1 [Paracidovorax citrulli AAC00-1]ATG96355.1 MFS transporter [Paracidovorax citrulli]
MTTCTSMSAACAARPPVPGTSRSRHRWKVLAAGVCANAAFSVAFSGIPMTAVMMRSSYQLDAAVLGLMLGLMGLGIAVSEMPWGMLTDRWGDRPVLLAGLAGTALALAAMAFWAVPSAGHVPARGLLAGGLVLVGLLGGSVNGASGRAIMQWFAEGERGLAMSIRQTSVPLGGAIGALLLPALALHGGFAAVYGVLAALSLLAALMAAAWVREPGQVAHGVAAAPAMDPGGPLRDARAWRLAAGIGLSCAPQFAVLSFGTVFLHDFVRAGLEATTATMAAVQVGAMALRVWSGRWTDRRRNRPAYLRACCALAALLFAAMAVLAGWSAEGSARSMQGVLLALLAACGLCVSAWHGVAYTELVVRVGAGRAGTALGMANTSVFIVCFLVPLLIPHLLAPWGWGAVWGAAAACTLAGRWLMVPRVPADAPRSP